MARAMAAQTDVIDVGTWRQVRPKRPPTVVGLDADGVGKAKFHDAVAEVGVVAVSRSHSGIQEHPLSTAFRRYATAAAALSEYARAAG